MPEWFMSQAVVRVLVGALMLAVFGVALPLVLGVAQARRDAAWEAARREVLRERRAVRKRIEQQSVQRRAA